MRLRCPPVLMYHAVTRASADPNAVCVSPERFEGQMGYLKRRGLRGVSMRQLIDARRSGRARGFVGLTFDDAYVNFLRHALPVLERFGFSATVFAVGGMLGRANAWDQGPRMDLLGADGLREVAERGMEVGSHGRSHIRLSGLDPGVLEEEVSESRRILEAVLDGGVAGFCYPYGSLDGRAIRAVRRAGYDYACAYKTRVERSLYDIPRTYVGERDGDLRLALKLRGLPRYARRLLP